MFRLEPSEVAPDGIRREVFDAIAENAWHDRAVTARVLRGDALVLGAGLRKADGGAWVAWTHAEDRSVTASDADLDDALGAIFARLGLEDVTRRPDR